MGDWIPVHGTAACLLCLGGLEACRASICGAEPPAPTLCNANRGGCCCSLCLLAVCQQCASPVPSLAHERRSPMLWKLSRRACSRCIVQLATRCRLLLKELTEEQSSDTM